MDDPKLLLEQLLELHNGLGDYQNLIVSKRYRGAESLRVNLAVLWGEVREDVVELGVPLQWSGSGRVFPTFETALSRFDSLTGSVFFQSIDHARTSLEMARGMLKRMTRRQTLSDAGTSPTQTQAEQERAYAFISYQTDDKHVAGRIRDVLSGGGIESFLAHEDIEVSDEWRVKILEEIGKADIFICLLSKSYFGSPWCVQETGIAAFREDMTVIPLSIDGSIPQGFISNIQSTKINPDQITIKDLLPGLLKHNLSKGIDLMIEIIGGSGSFRSAEANFGLILPYIGDLSDEQMKSLLEKVITNKQIHHANLCAHDYIPPLLESHGHLLDESDLEFLKDVCARYA